MAKAVVARIEGDDYQARFFWLQACRLLFPYTSVVRVSYEWNEIEGFDDVVVEYEPPVPDDRGGWCHTDCFQVKFHVTQNHAITAHDLMSPSFIGTSSVSLLQRLKAAQGVAQARGKSCRFILVTPWQVDASDELGRLVSNNAGELRLDRLWAGSPQSAMGRLRSAWAEHLKIDVSGLEGILRPFRIHAGYGSLSFLNEQLNSKLAVAGLRPIPDGGSLSPYDDLIRKLARAGRNSFAAADIKDICEHENLWVGAVMLHDDHTDIGIRSFIRRAEYMEDETEAMLDLVPYFSGRQILSHHLWTGSIIPEVRAFLEAAARGGRPYRLHLDTHTSIAMLAGYFLDPKAGVTVTPVQKTLSGKETWAPTPSSGAMSLPSWTFSSLRKHDDATDMAVGLSVTHDVAADVEAYLSRSGLEVRELLTATVQPEPSSTAVRGGAHALKLVQELVAEMREHRIAGGRTVHLFIAGPNAFTFILGQHARVIGQVQLYEYHFEAGGLGAYEPSLALPPENDTTVVQSTGG